MLLAEINTSVSCFCRVLITEKEETKISSPTKLLCNVNNQKSHSHKRATSNLAICMGIILSEQRLPSFRIPTVYFLERVS